MSEATNPEGVAPKIDGTTMQGAAEKMKGLFEPEPIGQPEAEVQDTEAQAESQPEVELEDEVEVEEVEAAPEIEEEAAFQNIYELAEAAGMEADEFLNTIKAKVKIDGKESELTLAELTGGYQREADYRRKTQELSEQRKVFEVETNAQKAQLQSQLTEMAGLTNMVEQQVLSEFNAVNWNDLKELDPTEYMLKRQEFAERNAQIQEAKKQVQSDIQQAQEQQQTQYQQQMAEVTEKERAALLMALPEWADDKKAKNEKEAITSYLSEIGYSQEEVGSLIDHRAVLIARKAMLYDKGKTEAAKQLAKPLKRVLKPGSTPNKQAQKSESMKAKRKAHKKTGTMDSAAALLRDIL